MAMSATSFADKVISVTGGASGMGAATCRLLAQRSAAAICIGDWNDTRFPDMEKDIREISPSTKVHLTKLDVSSSQAVNAWVEDIISKFGRLDGAANVAGLPQVSGGRKAPNILGETDDMWNRILAVNITGVFYCTRAQVKAMTSLPKTSRAIVNVSSMASLMHHPDTYAYQTSKAACAHFTSCVAKDILPFGIRANTVSPGATNTPMMAQFFPEGSVVESTEALGMQMLEASDIARQIVYLLSDEAAHVSGLNLPVGTGAP